MCKWINIVVSIAVILVVYSIPYMIEKESYLKKIKEKILNELSDTKKYFCEGKDKQSEAEKQFENKKHKLPEVVKIFEDIDEKKFDTKEFAKKLSEFILNNDFYDYIKCKSKSHLIELKTKYEKKITAVKALHVNYKKAFELYMSSAMIMISIFSLLETINGRLENNNKSTIVTLIATIVILIATIFILVVLIIEILKNNSSTKCKNIIFGFESVMRSFIFDIDRRIDELEMEKTIGKDATLEKRKHLQVRNLKNKKSRKRK